MKKITRWAKGAFYAVMRWTSKYFGIDWLVSEFWNAAEFFRFWKSKRLAERLHKKTGRRYYVIPWSNNRLRVVDNSFIDLYNLAV